MNTTNQMMQIKTNNAYNNKTFYTFHQTIAKSSLIHHSATSNNTRSKILHSNLIQWNNKRHLTSNLIKTHALSENDIVSKDNATTENKVIHYTVILI